MTASVKVSAMATAQVSAMVASDTTSFTAVGEGCSQATADLITSEVIEGL
ncbi:hypothetical protein CPT_Mendera_110 [Stenotrophomonas phage Mendera]|uniref:Uncharacterized protein n=1 Tax=Stenotrophomonas phage Mendera TaxID=2650877 RepID=A0A5P8PIU6_9CAUD|nr:hypothetical protein HWC60_gp285 [Stenotrophomonas phage Mendera]QFR56656.1 hypothetical protein CPT_Mendera_110 [Stenotrophomonas phage Mendera]